MLKLKITWHSENSWLQHAIFNSNILYELIQLWHAILKFNMIFLFLRTLTTSWTTVTTTARMRSTKTCWTKRRMTTKTMMMKAGHGRGDTRSNKKKYCKKYGKLFVEMISTMNKFVCLSVMISWLLTTTNVL